MLKKSIAQRYRRRDERHASLQSPLRDSGSEYGTRPAGDMAVAALTDSASRLALPHRRHWECGVWRPGPRSAGDWVLVTGIACLRPAADLCGNRAADAQHEFGRLWRGGVYL